MDRETFDALRNIVEHMKEEHQYADIGDVEGEGMTIKKQIALVEAWMDKAAYDPNHDFLHQ